MSSFKPFSINIKGKLIEFDHPAVMGILNVTPDSFYAESRCGADNEAILNKVEELISGGAEIVDVGGCSTRPGFEAPTEEEEWRRVEAGIKAVKAVSNTALISVDTFRGKVARKALEAGADIINDISMLSADNDLRNAVIETKAPLILTHNYSSRVKEDMHGDALISAVIQDLAFPIEELTQAGVADIIIDPGFGFCKTLEQNYEVISRLEDLAVLGRPILVGISRKSMLYRALDITPEEALNATTVLNTIALERGASILRVHDVKEAAEAVKISGLAASIK